MALHHSGFPIRKSAGWRLFAANRSLSQLVTSFVGSWCQGIRPVLFIAWTSPVRFAWVIVDNRLNCQTPQWKFHCFFHLFIGEIVVFPTLQKNLYLFQILAYIFQHMLTICSFYSSFVLFSFQWPQFRCFHTWWAQVDSNHRPRAYQARALTTWAMSPYV